MTGRAGNQKQHRRAKKVLKRKAVLAEKRKQALSAHPVLDQAKLVASSVGVSHCFVTDGLFETGLGYVVLARTKPSSTVALAFFLVDVHCLGVKNAFYAELTPQKFRDIVEGLMEREAPLVEIDPPCARKIVAEAAAYARGLGFSPHADYPPAEALFGDIDASACATVYDFGKDGKPFYFAGPGESFYQSKKILRTLTMKVGEGNFGYAVAGDFS